MTAEQSRTKEIEEIINQFKCPNDFQCYKSNFEALCEAEDIGIESYLKCLEENPRSCQFSVPFGVDTFADVLFVSTFARN
jgi:hypothetical protein